MSTNYVILLFYFTVQDRRNEINSGGLGVYQKMFIKKIIQLKLFKMPGNNEQGRGGNVKSLNTLTHLGHMIFGVLILVDH